MSVQGDPAVLPSAPAGEQRRASRWPRSTVERWLAEPNPVWIRELRQAARLSRTPIILAVVTSMMTLLIASIGGVLSVTAEPAQVGIGVFHTFFSLAFAVVTSVGPAVAAATIASERSGRTWEALLLTGLTPAAVAQGKFLAALTYVSLYVVMLAPVGALSFLFGGVTPTEVLLAFVFLFLIAALAVAFGLAMSSKFASPALAILVTLFVAVPLSFVTYLAGGVGLSFAVHELWPGVTGGAPVWLPTAYVRGDVGLPYFVFLVLCPLLAVGVPAWLFYEVTIANMAAPNDDRSTRLRVWILVSAPLLAAVMALSAAARKSFEWCVAGQALCWVFFTFVAFLIAGEPLGPSARILQRWKQRPPSAFLRALGPGVGRAALLSFVVALVTLGAVTATGGLLAATRDDLYSVLAFGGYAFGFSAFLLGFAAASRARGASAAVPRLLLAGVLFMALLGPYIAMAIGGILTDGNERVLLMAAPSPAFAFVVVDKLQSPGGDAELFALAGAAAALGWGLIGVGLLAAGFFGAKRKWELAQKARAAPEPAGAAQAG